MNATETTQDIEIPGATELERLVNRSRRIGADPTLVVHGGGNTSTKTREVDHLGRERDVLRIKGSGTDLKTIGPDGFPGLFLDELLPLRERAAMSDEEMVAYLAHCMVEPGSRRPSIETLLHAFLPARHVDHVHADAICALTNNPEPERHVRAALGSDVAVVPYIRPGFGLSRQVAELSGARAVVLAKHGLVTWGQTHEESYGLTLALVARAEAFLAQRLPEFSDEGQPDVSDADRRRLLATLRGRLSRDRRVILAVDPSQRVFADRQDVAAVATEARATPDHILRIGARSAVVRHVDEVDAVLTDFEREYHDYFARHQDRLPAGLGMLNPLPRVALVPGLGAVASRRGREDGPRQRRDRLPQSSRDGDDPRSLRRHRLALGGRCLRFRLLAAGVGQARLRPGAENSWLGTSPSCWTPVLRPRMPSPPGWLPKVPISCWLDLARLPSKRRSPGCRREQPWRRQWKRPFQLPWMPSAAWTFSFQAKPYPKWCVRIWLPPWMRSGWMSGGDDKCGHYARLCYSLFGAIQPRSARQRRAAKERRWAERVAEAVAFLSRHARWALTERFCRSPESRGR